MSAVPQSVFEFGEFRIDPRRRTLSNRAGDLIALTPKHFDTLLYLVENAGEVLEKDRLLSAIWPGMVVEENNLSQAVSQLRRILGDDGTEHDADGAGDAVGLFLLALREQPGIHRDERAR